MQRSDHIALEVCIDNAAGFDACAGLVDRIELCAGLEFGGLTPSAGLMQLAKACGLGTHVLIRPRTGDFEYDQGDLGTILNDIAVVRSIGLKGIVVGATKSGALDRDALIAICRASDGLELTLHRAIDVVTDPFVALDVAIDLGFSRILTSGGAKTATEGKAVISALQERANRRIDIMVGSGVNSSNVYQLVKDTRVRSVHASCTMKSPVTGAISDLGFGQSERSTDRQEIAQMRHALDAI